jgi:subtilisin
MSSQLKSRSLLLALTVLAVSLVIAPSASPNPTRGKPGKPGGPGKPGSSRIANRYIVVLKSSVRKPGAVAANQARAYGAQVTHVYRSALKGYAAKIPSGRVAALRANRNVRFVSPDRVMRVAGQTVGTGVSRIRAVGKANKGSGVNVAVIDTGIDLNHPDLAANIVGGYNCSGGGTKSYDDANGHGTHVAGIIAALDNGIGVVGVAPQAKLWAVRVLDKSGSGTWSEVICGIDFVDSKSPAKGGPISVANMSLGGFGSDDGNCGNTNKDALHAAICRAVADGVTFVVAAGNSGLDLSGSFTTVPAAYDEVLSVTALADSDGQPCEAGASTQYGADDNFASWSNYATGAADLNHLIAAPGVDIYSTYKGGGYATLSGTSMASPHVAGAAALYLSTHPGASPATVRDALKALGEPVNTNFNGECGGTTTKGKGGSQRDSHTDRFQKHTEVELRADSL